MHDGTAPRHDERVWSAADDAELPDLTALPGVAGVGSPPHRDLVRTYLDTGDLGLVRAGASLSRRGGDPDEDWEEGWDVRRPGPEGDGAQEQHRSTGDADRLVPPEELRRLVEDQVRNRDLAPVAEIRTNRSAHDLLGPDGRVLAALVDDRVQAHPLAGDGGPGEADSGDSSGPGAPVAWREWRLRVVEGDPGLLAAADELFDSPAVLASPVPDATGAVPRDRLVAHLVLAAAKDTDAAVRGPTRSGPARDVLHARLVAQSATLLRHDVGIRHDVPDSVHGARVACRRLRSALATGRPLVDREAAEALRAELRWLARSLGEARDAEVAHELLADLVAAQPAPLVRGPVAERLEMSLGGARRGAEGAALEVLGSGRYLALLEALQRLVADPPWTAAAERPAEVQLLPRVRKDAKRLRRRVSAAEAAAAAAGREDAAASEAAAYDEALHEARKAAKRLRYACELLEPAWGRDAKRLRKAAREVTRVLGQRQDTTVSREHLLGVADDAEQAGESAFTWGRLHGQEESRAERWERRFWRRTWPAAQKKKLRAWLRP